jgi:sulfopyruvate decarboxylase TPP-binding subunit
MKTVRPADISARVLLAKLQQCGINEAVSTPDFVQLSLHRLVDDPGSGMRSTYCSNENQALHVASGLIIGGRKPMVMMQNQGLHNCLNTLRTCGLDARLPLFMVIGQFGREFANVGQDSRLSRRRMVNLLLPVLDAMQIRSWTVDSDAEIDRVAEAWDHCRSRQAPVALVLGHYTAWD